MKRKRIHYIKNQIIVGLYYCLTKCILFNDRHILLVLKDKKAFNEINNYLLEKDIQNKYSKKLKEFAIHKYAINLVFTNGSILNIHHLWKDGSYDRHGTRIHEVFIIGDISHDMDIIFKCLCTLPFKNKKRKEENKNV